MWTVRAEAHTNMRAPTTWRSLGALLRVVDSNVQSRIPSFVRTDRETRSRGALLRDVGFERAFPHFALSADYSCLSKYTYCAPTA